MLEIGGLAGYSATNFIAAMAAAGGQPGQPGGCGVMYTVDIRPVTPVAPNHRIIIKNALDLVPADVDDQPLDLLELDLAPRRDRLVAVAHARQDDADRGRAQLAHDVDLPG